MSVREKFVVISDIHGCSLTLELMLKKLTEYYERTFVFIGDYIDRGPDSQGVVDQVIEFSKQVKCIKIRGNHEQMLLDALENHDLRQWKSNGGTTTIQSYNRLSREKGTLNLPSTHLHFFRNTKYYHESDDYFFVHAGIYPELTIKEAIAMNNHEQFMWERSHVESSFNRFEKTVVFGHTPQTTPLFRENMIGIDTGCVYTNLPGYGRLAALLLPENKVIFQNCMDKPERY